MVDFWTLAEFQKVISLLYKDDYYEHYLFISFWVLFMTGMRICETADLHWSDINFETGMLSITKTPYYKTLVLSYNGIPTSKHTLPRALEKLSGLCRRTPYQNSCVETFPRLPAYQHGKHPDDLIMENRQMHLFLFSGSAAQL